MTTLKLKPTKVTDIHLGRREAVMNNGDVLPITVMYNGCGDECGPDDALSFVVGKDGTGWWTCAVSDYIFGKPN